MPDFFPLTAVNGWKEFFMGNIQSMHANPPAPLAVATTDHKEEGGEATALLMKQILNAVQEIRARLAGAHKQFYTVEEIAELTGRSEYTVRRWIKEDRIHATRVTDTGPRGRLLIAKDQLNRLIVSGMGGEVADAITTLTAEVHHA